MGRGRIAALAAGGDRPRADRGRRTRPPRRSCCRWCRTSASCPATRRAPNEASEPQRAEVKGTGMLGAASLNGWTIAGEMRWKRLISPHGTCQLPKSRSSRVDGLLAAPRASARRWRRARGASSPGCRGSLRRGSSAVHSSSPQKTASASAPRTARPSDSPSRAGARSAPPAAALRGSLVGSASYASTSAGTSCGKAGLVAVDMPRPEPVERPAAAPFEQLHGMDARGNSRRTCPCICGNSSRLGAEGAGRAIGPVVGVLDPAVGRADHAGQRRRASGAAPSRWPGSLPSTGLV